MVSRNVRAQKIKIRIIFKRYIPVPTSFCILVKISYEYNFHTR
jgi:hypothetical protein